MDIVYENSTNVTNTDSLNLATKVVKNGLIPAAGFVAVLSNALTMAVSVDLGLKRSSVMFMFLVAASDTLQAAAILM